MVQTPGDRTISKHDATVLTIHPVEGWMDVVKTQSVPFSFGRALEPGLDQSSYTSFPRPLMIALMTTPRSIGPTMNIRRNVRSTFIDLDGS
jgi:hypothetical protein